MKVQECVVTLTVNVYNRNSSWNTATNMCDQRTPSHNIFNSDKTLNIYQFYEILSILYFGFKWSCFRHISSRM